MEIKFDKSFFARLTLLVCMTFFFYAILRPTPEEIVLRKYYFQDEAKITRFSKDKEKFFKEMGMIKKAAEVGEPEALRALMYLHINAKNGVEKNIPPIKPLFVQYKESCRQIVMGDEKLKPIYENLLELQ